MSASYYLNFNFNNCTNVQNNLNSKDVVTYFELMNKLTSIINIDSRNNNPSLVLNYNGSTPDYRKKSCNSMGSPNTSSISSADSSTVAMKRKNSKKKSYSNYKERVSTHAVV